MWANPQHFGGGGDDGGFITQQPLATAPDRVFYYNPGPEHFSRKVFVGGLPIDIIEADLFATFSQFGPVVVDWPHKNQLGGYVPPKGYVFLVFESESSVQALVASCYQEGDKYYMLISSPMMKNKPVSTSRPLLHPPTLRVTLPEVQIRPWLLADSDFVVESGMELHTRRTVFLGGVPRPLKAVVLAKIMDRLFGNVCYAGIDTDPELKYPKGAGRVSFANNNSYIAAISAKYVHLQHGDVDKRVEVKPYVLDEQNCDECGGRRCDGKYAQLFCAHVSCLQYYCHACWALLHAKPPRDQHTPFVKERSGGRHGGPPFHRLTLPGHCNSAAVAANTFQMQVDQPISGEAFADWLERVER